jgi:hypothetical protein
LFAAFKEGEEQTLDDTEKPTTGRGHKGAIQKTAEAEKVDQSAIRHSLRKVGEAAGEPIDPKKDSPAEVRRKVERLRQHRRGRKNSAPNASSSARSRLRTKIYSRRMVSRPSRTWC